MLVYLIAYAVLVIGTFAVVALVARRGDRATDLDSFRGLGQEHPALALALTLFLVAQAGVPFTSGFIAKFGVISAAVDERSYVIAIIAMVASVIAAFLYLRIIVAAWLQGDEAALAARAAGEHALEPVPIPFASGIAIVAAATFTLLVGIFPGWLIDATEAAKTFAT